MIYLDNAATTFPKPPSVCQEMLRCMTQYGGNPGRGGHPLSLAASQIVFQCRLALSDLLGIADPERILFTLNTTYALNMAIKGLVRHGDHVLISDMEHNAVLRPIHRLAQGGIIEYDVFPTFTGSDRQNSTRICAAIARLMRPNTRLVVCTHASNICSATLPIPDIAAFCGRHGLHLVVDAAQSAGHLPIDVDGWGLSALCAPAHKGLYGPQGSGILALGKNVTLSTLAEGGNGVHSLDANMPSLPPERYEVGTLPTPAIAGLLRGTEAVKRLGLESISEHEHKLFARAREILENLEAIHVLAPSYVGPVISFYADTHPSERLVQYLAKHGVCARGGFHCAALAHKTLGTPDGGAVRLSFGMFNTLTEVEIFGNTLATLLKDKA